MDLDNNKTVIDSLFSMDHPSAQIIKKYEEIITKQDFDADELNEII